MKKKAMSGESKIALANTIKQLAYRTSRSSKPQLSETMKTLTFLRGARKYFYTRAHRPHKCREKTTKVAVERILYANGEKRTAGKKSGKKVSVVATEERKK